MVEFAIVCVLLLTLLFGIIEFGLLIRDAITLNQAVREGVRAAALGKSASEVNSLVTTSLVGLDPAKLSDLTISYRVRLPGGWPVEWTVGTPEAIPATSEVQLKVGAKYSHEMITGGFFGSAPIVLSGQMVMRRE